LTKGHNGYDLLAMAADVKDLQRLPLLRMLVKLGACAEAREWVAEHADSSLEELWEYCHRFDWMLWLALKLAGQPGWPDRKKVVKICQKVLSFIDETDEFHGAAECENFRTPVCPCSDWGDCWRRGRDRAAEHRLNPEKKSDLKHFPPPVDFDAMHAYSIYRRAGSDDRIRMSDVVRMWLRPGPVPKRFFDNDLDNDLDNWAEER
jgi:hypothetical protein